MFLKKRKKKVMNKIENKTNWSIIMILNMKFLFYFKTEILLFLYDSM